jgi:hypothetical protein
MQGRSQSHPHPHRSNGHYGQHTPNHGNPHIQTGIQNPGAYPAYFVNGQYGYTPQYQYYPVYYPAYPASITHQNPGTPLHPDQTKQSTLHYSSRNNPNDVQTPTPSINYKQIEVRTAESDHLLKALKNKLIGKFTGPMKKVEGPINVRVVAPKSYTQAQPQIAAAHFHENKPQKSHHNQPSTQTSNAPSSQISWFTGSPHELNRPSFKPLFSSEDDSPKHHTEVSESKATLLSMQSLEREKKQKARAAKVLNSKIYEQPRKPFSEQIRDGFKNLFRPASDPFTVSQGGLRRIQVSGVSVLLFTLSALFLAGAFGYTQMQNNPGQQQVAGAQESLLDEAELEAYSDWINKKNGGEFSAPEADLDSDQLTNYEEFIIGTDPVSAHTCDPETTDMQNILNVVNPVTCQEINLENEDEIEFFSEIINLPDVQAELLKEPSNPATTPTGVSPSIREAFGIAEFGELDTVSRDTLVAQVETTEEKKAILATIEKIDAYVTNHRSYEVFDRDYETPVHSATYLDVARRYNVPLKYVLAIARLESRFGTDRFTNNGNLTRPGQYQNIYSIGLTDGGQNLKYETWEEGVEGFGKWYTKFHERGISDCAKWRIYNPNGDYCAKVENLASEIEEYLNS